MSDATHRFIINDCSCFVIDDGKRLQWLNQEQCGDCGGDEYTAVRLPRTGALLAVTCDRCKARYEAGKLMGTGA